MPDRDTRDSKSLGFWQKLAKRSQSNLYFALAFLPSDRREAFRDVYRFLRAADDAADEEGVADDVRRARLADFRRELAAVYEGHATHPEAVRLTDAVRRFGLSRAHFETILGALEADVAPRRFASRAELERWCEDMSSSLGRLCLEILLPQGEISDGARGYARDMGVALQLANIVRDVAEDAHRGHLYLPDDELSAADASAAEILAGRFSPPVGQVIRRLADRARLLVATARAQLSPEERRRLLVPEIWADVYLALLDEIATAGATGYDVFGHRPYLKRRRKVAIAMGRWLREEGSRLSERLADRLFPPAP